VEGEPGGKADKARSRILRKRALHVLALGLFQAFTLITLFALLRGAVMGGPNRTDLIQASVQFLDPISRWLGELIPNWIVVGETDAAPIRFLIFPWAILTWTVELFFFSAIFERILNRPSN
jgi:hypothetical protein